MLGVVLMRAIAKVAVVVVALGTVVAWLWAGPGVAWGFAAGGLLAAGSGLGLVFLAGRLLSGARGPGMGAGTVGTLMGVKLVAVLAIAWTLLAVVQVDGLGFLFGLGAGVLSVVIGAQLGQGSPEGQAALRAEEAELADELEEGEDSGPKSG